MNQLTRININGEVYSIGADVVQYPGGLMDAVMSQKAVTEALSSVANVIRTNLGGTSTSYALLKEGVIVATTSEQYRVMTFANVQPGITYTIKGSTGYRNDMYAFQDSEGNVVSYTAGTPGDYAVFTKEVVAPEGAARLLVSYLAALGIPSASYISGFEAKMLDVVQTTGYREDAVMSQKAITKFIEEVSTKTDTYLQGTDTLNASLKAGIIGAGGTDSYRVTTFKVQSGTKYYIAGSTGYRNDKYAFYDSEDNVLAYKSGADGAYSNFTEEVIAPERATKLIVPYLYSTNTSRATAYYIAYSLGMPKIYIGKKWAVFGDSLTHVNSRADTKYYDYIADELGCSIINYGVSGSGYKARESAGDAFYQRMLNIDADAFDVLTIFGSFNDIGQAEIGTPTDTGTGTLCGCINTALDNYYSVAPFKPIGIVTPTPWWNSNPKLTTSIQSQYVEALIEIAKQRGIPCLDLFHSSGLRPWDAEFVNHFYTENGVTESSNATHPNSEAHKLYLYPPFRQFIKTLL